MPSELMSINLETTFENIRQTEDGKYSVFDYLRICTDYKNPRDCFKRLCDNYPDIVGFCDSVKMLRSDGKKANTKTPVTDERGLLYLAYLESPVTLVRG